MKKFLRFFDVLEDKIRHILSHWPIIYAIVGIIGISLAWRGVWHFADEVNMSPLFSFILGVVILLASGLLVAVAIGDEVIISSFRGRKKINEVKLEEALTMVEKIDEIKNLLDKIEKRLNVIKQEEEEIEREVEKRI
jgi:hypothetical protein